MLSVQPEEKLSRASELRAAPRTSFHRGQWKQGSRRVIVCHGVSEQLRHQGKIRIGAEDKDRRHFLWLAIHCYVFCNVQFSEPWRSWRRWSSMVIVAEPPFIVASNSHVREVTTYLPVNTVISSCSGCWCWLCDWLLLLLLSCVVDQLFILKW